VTKISTSLIKNALLEEDSVKKVKVEKLKLSKHRKMAEYKGNSDLSSRLTKVKQVEIPKSSPMREAKSAKRDVVGIDSFGTLGKGMKTTSKKDKVVSAKAKSEKPNQTTKMKTIKGEIKNTEGGTTKKANNFGTSDYASGYVDKMSHGSKAFGKAKGSEADAMGKVTSAKLKPSRKGSVANVSFSEKTPKKVTQTKTPASKRNDPSDAPKKATWEKAKGGSHNLVESGVVVKLDGKTKTKFDIVNQDVLKRMYEQYEKAGYELVFERTNNVAWRKNKQFVRKLSEAIDASFNFAPKSSKALRKQALNIFSRISQPSYSNLYESRAEFSSTIMSAFRKIEEMAERNYLNKLTIYEGTVRAVIDGDLVDFDMITEARSKSMALRQFRNQIFEQYGFDADIKHLFLDSKKYSPRQIKEWTV